MFVVPLDKLGLVSGLAPDWILAMHGTRPSSGDGDRLQNRRVHHLNKSLRRNR